MSDEEKPKDASWMFEIMAEAEEHVRRMPAWLVESMRNAPPMYPSMKKEREGEQSVMSEDQQAPKWKAVYTIIERGNGKRHWLRIGTAFVNRDNSLNVVLDVVPITGKLHIRDANTGPGVEAGARPPTEKQAFREEDLGGGAADDDIPF